MRQYLKAMFLAIIISSPAVGQSDIELVKTTIDKSTIEGHIYFLASDELKGRETGTPEIDIAAKYLSTTLQRYGVKQVPGAEGYFQPVKLERVKPPTSVTFKVNGKNLDGNSGLIALTAEEIKLDTDIVFLNYGFEDDYKGKDVKGKIVIAKAGAENVQSGRAALQLMQVKRKLANDMGVSALVEFATMNNRDWNNVSGYLSRERLELATNTDNGHVAHFLIKDTGEEFLNQIIKSKSKTASVEISGGKTEFPMAKNVVGMVEGTDPKLKDEYVIYSAHYDHVGIGAPNAEGDSIYNGARDNAVGVVTVLSAAESIAKNPTKRSALFILFTGEEKGLLGSSWYVNNPLIPLKKMVYCFNSDNASYNDTSVASIVGLNRTTAADHIKKACKSFGLTALDDPAPEQNLFDRSDNVNFAKKGIPAPTFSLGFTAFDAEVFKYYHQVTDNPDNLDYDYLLKFFQSYVLACRLIANDSETPFWVEGDKYYEAGTQLYK